MYLREKLHKLFGHEVSIRIWIGTHEKLTKQGILEQVGADHIVIRPLASVEGSFETSGQWLVRLKGAMPIIHLPHCNKCREDEVVEREKAAEREELLKLVDHTISFSGADFDIGILTEVSGEYIVVEPLDAVPEIDENGVEYLSLKIVSIDSAKPIFHAEDCKKCKVESAVQPVA